MKNIFTLSFVLLLAFFAKAQCNLSNFTSAYNIRATDYPYFSVSSGITVSVSTNTSTLSNFTYACNGTNFNTANPSHWINATTHFVTFNFSAPVVNFSVVVNGTNQNETFYFNTSSGSCTLSNYCAVDWTAAGNTITYTNTPVTGSLISVTNTNPAGATQYTVTQNGVGSGSRISLLDCFVLPSLPIFIYDFQGIAKTTSNEVSWKTQFNTKCDEIVLEKSANREKDFEEVKKHTASANTNYVYTDETPYPVSFYRLKFIDKDGNVAYSHTIELQNSNAEVLKHKIYPNPAHKELFVYLSNSEHETVQIQLIDYHGRAVMLQNIQVSAYKPISIPLDNISNGLYILHITNSKNEQFTEKVIVKH
jgi:hypothetical protein